MAERLTTDRALALLGNTLQSCAILVVVITLPAPISGAYSNPVVTTAFALCRQIDKGDAVLSVCDQTGAALLGILPISVCQASAG
jgi:glycerol uptake facilitator-like aquaporin